MGALKPPGHFHLQNYHSDNSPEIYSFESQLCHHSRAETEGPQTQWPLSVCSSRGQAEPQVCCPCFHQCKALTWVCCGMELSTGPDKSQGNHPLIDPLIA